VHSWESLEQTIAQAPLDVLIIDRSALDQVDLGWLQSAYRDGTIIIGISIEFEVISGAINDRCAENGAIDISKHYDEWFYYFAYWVRVDPADAKSIVDRETLERCNDDFDGVLGVAITHIANSHPLSAAASTAYLADTIRNDLISRKLEGYTLPSQSAASELPADFTSVQAQEPVSPTDPLFEEMERARAISDEFYRREVENFDFANYRVVYLVATELDDTVKIATPDAVAEQFSAQIAHTWEEVEEILTEGPIDIFLIHNSAVGQADREWVRAAYRDGTMIVGLSTPFETLTELAGDACAKNENPFVPEVYPEWFLYLIYWTSAVTPEDGKPIVDAAWLETCKKNGLLERGVSAAVTDGAFLTGLAEIEGLGHLSNTLMLHVLNRKQARIQMPSERAND
jgi:hypothetical protein